MQISLNDLLIKSSPSIYLPRCPNKSQYCFSTLRGNLRKIMATFASEAYGTEQTTASKTKTETKTLQKKHTTFFIANWVIKFIYTRRKAAQNELAELPRFFFLSISGSNRLEEESLLLTRLPGISVSMQYHFLWHFIIMLNQRVSLPRFSSVLEA